jgi:hypothetical protein
VSGALLVRRLAALTGYFALLAAIHRCKSAIFFGHVNLPAPKCYKTLGLQRMCHKTPVTLSNEST